MPYQYPTRKTGTSQDLFSVVVRAYEKRLNAGPDPGTLPPKPAYLRAVMEAPFIVVGMLVAWVLELLPARTALAFHDKVFSALAGKNYPFHPDSPALSRAEALIARLRRESGREPAMLALISHPPVSGELAHLNLELTRHAQLALYHLRGAPCRPRLVAAVDPFALDTLSMPAEGVYAGFVGTYHVGLDRMAIGRGLLTGLLLRRSSWSVMINRLLRLLRSGNEAALVLAGGVPATTRVLYALREWVGRARKRAGSTVSPAQVLERLRKHEAFRRFETEGPQGAGLARNAWRMAEGWAMAALSGYFQEEISHAPSSESGRLENGARRTLLACLEALGVSEDKREAALQELATELSRETPYRERLFKLLASEVLGAGRPLLILPIAHRLEGGISIELGEAWGWTVGGTSRLSAVKAGTPGKSWEGTPEEFAHLFGDENFA